MLYHGKVDRQLPLVGQHIKLAGPDHFDVERLVCTPLLEEGISTMRLLHTLVLSALASLGSAAAIVRDEPAQYDAIIIGGGPAGLAALSGLARVRRNVLLIDSGVYRNAPTRHMHDVLGFDGRYFGDPGMGPAS